MVCDLRKLQITKTNRKLRRQKCSLFRNFRNKNEMWGDKDMSNVTYEAAAGKTPVTEEKLWTCLIKDGLAKEQGSLG